MFDARDNLRELAQRAGLDKDPRIRTMIDSPLLSGEKREKFAKFLRPLAARNCPRPHAFLPAPTHEQAGAGVIPMARIVTGRGSEYMYMLRPEEAATGTLVAGPTGAGKSVLLAQVASGFHRNGYPVWVLDTEGDLTALLVRAEPDILVVDYRQFRQELFEPDPRMGLEWIEFISKAIANWSDPLTAGDGMRCMSREVVIALRSRNAPLTPHQFLEELLRRKHRLSAREGNFLDSLRNRFEGMIVPLLGRTYSGGHHNLLAMLRQSPVWRLQGLSVDALSFFATELILAISLIQHPRPGGALENLQIIDEFARFQSSDFRTRLVAGESLIVDHVRTARKMSLGVMLGSQTPQLLPRQVLSDMNTMISFRPIDGSFLDCVAQAMNLSREQEAELMELSDREPRQAVVRCPGITSPFKVELPNHSPAWATPEEIAQRIEQTNAWLDSIYQPSARPREPIAVDEAKPGPLFTPRDHPLSKALAKDRGCFPNWAGSTWDTQHGRPMRNAACVTIAPTGSISILAGCSSGIEPIFGVVTKRRALGKEFVELHPLIERLGRRQGWLTARVRAALLEGAPASRIPGFPTRLARLLVTAHEVAPEWHVRIQTAFQQYADGACQQDRKPAGEGHGGGRGQGLSHGPRTRLQRDHGVPGGFPARSCPLGAGTSGRGGTTQPGPQAATPCDTGHRPGS